MTGSGAITEYLLARYGGERLEPAPRPAPGSHGHGRFLQWLHFPEATMMPHLGTLVRQGRMADDRKDRVTIEHAEAKVGEMLSFIEGRLVEDYILGDGFTAADVMLGYSLALAEQLGVPGHTRPRLRGYLETLKARPGFIAALAG